MGKRIITDIVLTTRNRLHYLKRTVEHIFQRTRSPYALSIINDASDDGETVGYLLELYAQGRLAGLLMRGDQAGQMANLNVGTWLAFSDPVVFVDDDVLCPDVEPDWLTRGLAALPNHPELGVMALNHPGANRRPQEVRGEVTYCRFVGGTFVFVRRKLLMAKPLPHFRNNFGSTPTLRKCNDTRAAGFRVGYLTHTYCYHIGEKSIITDGCYKGKKSIEPVDWKTLEPPERWRC